MEKNLANGQNNLIENVGNLRLSIRNTSIRRQTDKASCINEIAKINLNKDMKYKKPIGQISFSSDAILNKLFNNLISLLMCYF